MSNKELTIIVSKYGTYMSDFIARSVKNPQDREDILQEVWLILARRAPKVIDQEKLCGLLRKTAFCATQEYYRQHPSFSSQDIASFRLERVGATTDGHQAFEREYILAIFEKAARDLSPKHLRYVTDYYIKGISLEVIADNMGVTYSNVRQNVRGFADQLKRAYGKCV